MNKEQRDGLFMDNSIVMIDEKKPGFPMLSRFIQVFAILIGGWSSVSILLESIPVPAKVLSIDMAILLCAGIALILCLIPSYDLVKIFFGVLFYGLFFYSRWPHIRNGFFILENVVIDRISFYYGTERFEYIADYTAAAADSTLVFIMIVIPAVTLLTIAVIRSRFVNATAILLFLPVTISFLFGLIPSEKYLISYIAAALYLTRSGFSARHLLSSDQKVMLHRIYSRAAVWLSLICIALFFFLKLFISEEKYEDIKEINNLKTEIQTKLLNFSIQDVTKSVSNIQLPTFNLPSGGLNGGELGKVGEVEYTDSEQLRITAPLSSISNGVYLKGYVGSVYTGDKWDDHSDVTDTLYKELQKKLPEEDFEPVNQMSELIKLVGQTGFLSDIGLKDMRIKYNSANQKYLYVPYFTDFGVMDNIKYKQDLYASSGKRKDNYTVVFYNPQQLYDEDMLNLLYSGGLDFSQFGMPQLDEFSEKEKLYRDFVYQAYTQLPEQGLERLKQEFWTVNYENPAFNIADKVEYVQSYLTQNTRYTLSPGKLPKDKDFVEYFLYENKKGYCAHYASAATLMLRAMGVPARYVEGYAVGPSDIISNTISTTADTSSSDGNADGSDNADANYNVEVSVKDYNAHAWVEVYFDSYGWLPVDFTPFSSIDYSALNHDNIADDDTEKATPTPKPLTPTPRANLPQTDQNKPDVPKPQTPVSAGTDISGQQHKLDSLFLVLFIVLVTGTAAAFLIVFLYRKKKKNYIENRNKRAILLFARMERILTFIRGLGKKGARLEDSEEYVKKHCYTYFDEESFACFMETVRKARYGKGKISTEELSRVERFHQEFYEKVYRNLSPIKRMYLKLLLFI